MFSLGFGGALRALGLKSLYYINFVKISVEFFAVASKKSLVLDAFVPRAAVRYFASVTEQLPYLNTILTLYFACSGLWFFCC